MNKQLPTRLRNHEGLRSLVRETQLSMKQMIYPIFLVEGSQIKEEILSMKEQYHYSVDALMEELPRFKELGIRNLLIFASTHRKSIDARSGAQDEGVVQRGIREIKKKYPEFLLIADVCLCQYKEDGHCCIYHENQQINRKETLKVLGEIATSYARAGADMVAPSDMMDGRVAAIREVLDQEGYEQVSIMAYSAKYASAFYGPFREAAHSAPAFGDRKMYQMDPANRREAIKEVELDIFEGADLVMIKPAMAYLDVISDIKAATKVPVVAYQVSGEYVMLRDAVRNQVFDERAIYESLLAIKRSGADIIISYFTPMVMRFVGGISMLERGRSKEAYEKAKKIIPGGVNSPVRSFSSVDSIPVYAKNGKGSRLWDIDGNEYIDYIQSWGPLILGHASPIAKDGIMEAMDQGTSFGLSTLVEEEMASILVEAVKEIEMVRMVSSGTEATMSALRAARAYTKRDKIIKFEGCYHGHQDALLVKAGSGVLTQGFASSKGVALSVIGDTLVAKYNDIESVCKLYEQYPSQIAAVIIEPIPGNMGLVTPKDGFLEELRRLTKEQESVLIFDEVISGFRFAYGSYSTYGEVEADLVCLGKIIGGGMPVGAYGGRREIMEMIAPLGEVYQAGTLSGNPIALTMGKNVLLHLKENPSVYFHLEELALRLEKGFVKNLTDLEFDGISVKRFHGALCQFFSKEPLNNYEEIMACDTKQYAAYFRHMLEQGVLLAPAQFELMFLSAAHTKEDIDHTIFCHYQALKKIKEEFWR